MGVMMQIGNDDYGLRNFEIKLETSFLKATFDNI